MLRLLVAALIAVSATGSTLALDEVMRDGVKKYIPFQNTRKPAPHGAGWLHRPVASEAFWRFSSRHLDFAWKQV